MPDQFGGGFQRNRWNDQANISEKDLFKVSLERNEGKCRIDQLIFN